MNQDKKFFLFTQATISNEIPVIIITAISVEKAQEILSEYEFTDNYYLDSVLDLNLLDEGLAYSNYMLVKK